MGECPEVKKRRGLFAVKKWFSIIMPAFNRESLICEALDSVKAQTYRPIEIIVVDDGSTDSTAHVVREWAEEATLPEISNRKSARGRQSSTSNYQSGSSSWEVGGADFIVRYFYQENAGASAARNRGIQEVRGDYIQFLDSDDHIFPERLQRLAETFEEEKCDFIQTGFEGFDAESGEVIQTLYGKPGENQFELALMGRFWANTLRAALSVELVRKIDPWKVEMSCFEDREYMERALAHSRKAVAIREVLAGARRGGSVRISDKLKSREGRSWRIFCEEQLVNALRERVDISFQAKQEFASRLYALGFRCNACDWADLGKQCGALAERVGVKLDPLGWRRRIVWKLGRVGGLFYEWCSNVKS